MLPEPSPPPPFWSEASAAASSRFDAFRCFDAFCFFAALSASAACGLLAARRVRLPVVLRESFEIPGLSAALSGQYSLPELLAPALGSFGRYSSPADAAYAEEASTSEALSASASVASVPRLVNEFSG